MADNKPAGQNLSQAAEQGQSHDKRVALANERCTQLCGERIDEATMLRMEAPEPWPDPPSTPVTGEKKPPVRTE
jgi:hypothetical protein